MKLAIDEVIHKLSRTTVDVAYHPDYIKLENKETVERKALEVAMSDYNIAMQRAKDADRVANEAKNFLVERGIRAKVIRWKLLASTTTDM
jgi:hypothetical protein